MSTVATQLPAPSTRALRIGYLYPFRAYPPRGGNHIHAFQLIRGFQALGHYVVTVADSSLPGVLSVPATAEGIDELLRNIDVLYVRLDGNFLGEWPLAVAAIERATVPVVWEINSPANERLAFSYLGGDRPRPHNATGRIVDKARRRAHAARQLPAIRRDDRLRARLGQKVAAAICVSTSVGRYATEQLGLSNIVVLPNGSDPALNHPERTPIRLPDEFNDHLKVLYAGSPIYPWQGFDVITRAIEQQQQRTTSPMVFMFLVNQRAGSIPERDNVLVYEAVPYDDVGSYITAADVCVSIHPHHYWTRWGFHGSPTKLYDYMACGRTVLASRVGQLAEVIEDGVNGLLCDNTPEDLLRKLDYLADRPDERAAMGQRARADVLRSYNWNAIAAATLDVFEHVL